MQRLYRGIEKFQKDYFKKKKNFFEELSKGQSPDVLFFACLDSRVSPTLLTQSEMGEMLIVRNVGNIIPPYSGSSLKQSCTAAAIEFALLVQKVKNIIVCGHSDCGALRALYYDEKKMATMPNLREWLYTIAQVKARVASSNINISDEEVRKKATEKEHIIAQLENLLTYPLIEKALKEKKVKLQGWYYEIGTGDVYLYNWSTKRFEKIESIQHKKNRKGRTAHIGSYWEGLQLGHMAEDGQIGNCC